MKIFKPTYFKPILVISIFLIFTLTFLGACRAQKPKEITTNNVATLPSPSFTPIVTPKTANLFTSSSPTPFSCDFTVKNDTELKTANDAVRAGQTICLYPGLYNSSDSYELIPSSSGTPNSYITYLGLNQSGEIVFNNRNFLEGKSYIIYQNINFHGQNNTPWFGTDSLSNHIIFDNCTFSGGISWLALRGDYFTIRNSKFNGLGKDMVLIEGSYSSIQNNDFSQSGASHSLLAITQGASHIIVRQNYFRNPYDRALLAVKIEGANSEKILIEDNIFIDNLWNRSDVTPFPNDPENGGAEAIRISIPKTIFRNNLVLGTNIGDNGEYTTALQGIVFSVDGNKIWFEDERIYHNTFYGNKKNSITLRRYPGVVCSYCDNNVFKNNIIFQSGLSEFYQIDTGFQYLWDNNIIANTNKYPVIKINHNNPNLLTVNAAQQYLPEYFSNNINLAPTFQNPQSLALAKKNPENFGLSSLHNFMCDFSLSNSSPGKQAATHLTTITESSVNSTIIKVQDALYFYDGFNIEQGDKIIIGSNETVIITQIVDQNTIRIDRPINTLTNERIYLNHTGNLADIGIYGCSK